MTLDLLKEPPRLDGPLTFSPLVEDDPAPPDHALEVAAKKAKLRQLAEALVSSPAAVELLLPLLEASGAPGAYWNPEKHPRWPKGTPHAGEFMKVGQRFELNGVEYDIESVLPGKIHARVATKGSVAGAKTIDLDAKTLEKIKRPEAEPIVAATAHQIKQTGTAGTATVIDPHVKPETHDAAIPIPKAATGHITPEEWKRFGKLDQERYSQLMERYGTWAPGKAQGLVNQAKKGANAATLSLVTSGYQSQYGSSSGLTISLHQAFSSVVSTLKGESKVEKARKDFEDARALQHELASAIQWDLFNRAKAPDVALFHMSPESRAGSTWSGVLKGNKPVFSGLSMSQHYGANFGFGDNVFATPMAVRHVVLATVSADVVNHDYQHEKEVAVADPFVVDPKRSTMWGSTEITPSQSKWLNAQTKGAASGETLEKLFAAINGGEPLPVPPAQAEIHMDNAGGTGWKAPPAAAVDVAKGFGSKTGVTGNTVPDLKWVKADGNGDPIPLEANQLRLTPGDFIQGNPNSSEQGTVYVIVPDPTDTYMGVAYYKLTEPDGITPAAPGQAYQFQGGGETKFKKIDAHFDWDAYEHAQAAAGGVKAFHPEAWTESGDQKLIGDLAAGTKFKVHGQVWEVTAKLSSAQSSIKLVETGQTAKMNNDYKTPWLQLKPGMTEAGGEEFDPAQFFGAGPKAPLSELGLGLGDVLEVGGTHYRVDGLADAEGKGKLFKLDGGKAGTVVEPSFAGLLGSKLTPKPLGWQDPQPGDSLAIDGKKAVVTKVLKDGTVQINLKPGVMKVQPDDAVLAGLFSPEAHVLGSDKAKLKDMPEGSKFHAGSGSKLRPYLILSHDGKKTSVLNLDTGEKSELSSSRAFRQLHAKPSGAVSPPELASAVPSNPAETFDPNAWETHADATPFSSLKAGDKFFYKGVVYGVKDENEGKLVLSNLATGNTTDVLKVSSLYVGGAPVHLLKPKGQAESFAGQKVAFHAIPVGSYFQSEGEPGGGPAGPIFHKIEPGKATNLATGDSVVFQPENDFEYHVIDVPDEVPSTSAPFEVGEPLPPVVMTPNPEGKKFLELGLGVGDKVEMIGQPETVTAVYGEPGTEGHVYDTVNDATGVKSTYGVGGTVYSYWKADGSTSPKWPLEKGDLWKAPSGVTYQITSTKKFGESDWAHWGKQVKPGGTFGKVAPLNIDSPPPASAAPALPSPSAHNEPKEFKDVAVGDTFVVHGATWKKTSDLAGEIVAVHGKEQAAPVGYPGEFFSDDVVDTVPKEVTWAGGFEVGQSVQWSSTMDDGSVKTRQGVIIGFDASGQPKVKTDEPGDGFYVVGASKLSLLGPAAAGLTPGGWQATAKSVPASDLKIGDRFAVQDPTASHSKEDMATEWEVIGLPEGDGEIPVKVVRGTGSIGVETTVSQTFTPSYVFYASPTVEPDAPPLGPDLPAAMPATAYDPGAYVGVGKQTLGDLAVGDIFVGAKNGKHYLVTKTGAPSGLTALDLMTGKSSTPWKYEKVAEIMKPKATTPFEEADWKVGDAVKLGELEPGDHFSAHWGDTSQVYEVVAAAPKGEAGNVTIAAVGPDFGLGKPTSLNTSPLLGVTFHAHSNDVAAAKAELAGKVLTGKMEQPQAVADVSKLEVADLTPFSPKSKSGGGYTFTKAKHAGVGSILQDKGGALWKVTQSGSSPVVTDGKKHYLVNGDHNLKVVEMPFHDDSPPLGTSVGDTLEHLAVADHAPAPSGTTLGSLGLAAGDTFTGGPGSSSPGVAWKVEKVMPSGWYSVTKVGTTHSVMLGAEFDVGSYEKGSGVGWDEKVLPSQLEVGDHVKAKSGSVYQVTAVNKAPGGKGAEIELLGVDGPGAGTAYPAIWYEDSIHKKKGAGYGWTLVPPSQGGSYADPESAGEVATWPTYPDYAEPDPAAWQPTGAWSEPQYMPVGTVFDFHGSLFKVVATDDYDTMVQDIGGHHEEVTMPTETDDELFSVHALAADLPEDAPRPVPATDPNWGTEVGQLEPGTVVKGTGGTAFEVVGHKNSDKTQIKVIGSPNQGDQFAFSGPVEMGKTMEVSALWKPSEVEVGKAGSSAPAASYSMLGDLAPGDKFKSVTGVEFEVMSHGGGQTSVKNLSTGKLTAAATTTPAIPLDEPAAASPDPAVEKMSFEGYAPNETMTAGALPVGSLFVHGGLLYEKVQAYGGGADISAKVVDGPSAAQVGTSSWLSKSLVPDMLPAAASPEGTPKLPANANGSPVGSLAVGASFQTADGTVYEVTAKTAGGSVEVKPLHFVDDGEFAPAGSFGPTYVPEGIALRGWQEWPGGLKPGTQITDPDQFEAGMVFTTPTGNVYEVQALQWEDMGDEFEEDWTLMATLKMLHVGDQSSASWEKVGVTLTDEWHADDVPEGYVVVDPANLPSSAAAGKIGAVDEPLEPIDKGTVVTFSSGDLGFASGLKVGDHYKLDGVEYVVSSVGKGATGEVVGTPWKGEAPAHALAAFSPKSQTGGGYFFGKLGQIPEGTEFTDKSGVPFVKAQGSAYRDADGNEYVGDAAAKVKLLKAPGPPKKDALAGWLEEAGPVDELPKLGAGMFFQSPFDEDGNPTRTTLMGVHPGEVIGVSGGNTYKVVGHVDGKAVLKALTGSFDGYFQAEHKPGGQVVYVLRPL